MKLGYLCFASRFIALGIAFAMAACGGGTMKTSALTPAVVSLQASHADTAAKCTWKIAPSQNPGISNLFNGVAGSSTSDVWAVGKYATSSGGPVALTEHWNGSAWGVVTTPAIGYGSTLAAVDSVSSTDVWAVGKVIPTSGPIQSLTLHWNGSQWSQIASPSVAGQRTVLYTVKANSAKDVWAVGASQPSSGYPVPFAIHWNGKAWSAVPIVNQGMYGSSLGTLSGTSAKDVWAVGGSFTNPSNTSYVTLIEHWNGKHWSVIKSPNANSGDNVLNATVAVTSSDAWAVGDYYTGTVFNTLTEHWNGKAWSIVKSPNVGTGGDGIFGAAAFSSTSVWAVGEVFVGSSGTTLSMKWNGKAWAVVKSPNLPGSNPDAFNAAAALHGSKTLWAVGANYVGSSQPNQTLTASNACAG